MLSSGPVATRFMIDVIVFSGLTSKSSKVSVINFLCYHKVDFDHTNRHSPCLIKSIQFFEQSYVCILHPINTLVPSLGIKAEKPYNLNTTENN